MKSRRRISVLPNGVFLVSLGCPKNLVDTEVMAGSLATAGYCLCMDEQDAGIYLINTCAFLPAARAEAEEAIRAAVRWKRRAPGRRIVVTGCLPERDRDGAYRRRWPEVDQWLPVDAMAKLVEFLGSGASADSSGAPTFLVDHTMPRLLLTLPHLAYLKIADGCDNRCSYCAIPGIRGALRSRPAASVLAEAAQLLENGVKELLVIAQDITAYGADRPGDGDSIAKLVRALDRLPGDFVIRLLYAHPAHVTPDFIAAMAECGKVLPYLDLPLQHINDRILRGMGRKADRAATERVLDDLRREIPGIALRTTFITGFPGETEAESAELAAFLRERQFERCGVFPFSPEPGTPAAELPDQVPAAVAEARAGELLALQQEIMRDFHLSLVGRRFRVLVDRVAGGKALGRGALDAPEIDNDIVISPAAGLQAGRFYDIIIERADTFQLHGKKL